MTNKQNKPIEPVQVAQAAQASEGSLNAKAVGETRESLAPLPCPFCGGTPSFTRRDVEPQGDSWYGKKVEEFITCDCGICLFDKYFHEGFISKEEAYKAWNTRARALCNVQTNDNALNPNPVAPPDAHKEIQ